MTYTEEYDTIHDENGRKYRLVTEPDGTEQIEWLDDVTPQPGDVVVLSGRYTGVKDGARAVIDGTHYGMDFDDGRGPRALICFGASAFRGDGSSRYNTEGIVSCSGGPLPLVPFADLELAGHTDQLFWKWKDYPRGDGGEKYTANVNLWLWKGERS